MAGGDAIKVTEPGSNGLWKGKVICCYSKMRNFKKVLGKTMISSAQWLEEEPWLLCGSPISRLKPGASGSHTLIQASGKHAHWGGSMAGPGMPILTVFVVGSDEGMWGGQPGIHCVLSTQRN